MCGVLVDRQNHGILPYWFNQSVISKAFITVRNGEPTNAILQVKYMSHIVETPPFAGFAKAQVVVVDTPSQHQPL